MNKAPIAVLVLGDEVALRCEMAADEEVLLAPEEALALAHGLVTAAMTALGGRGARFELAWEKTFARSMGTTH